MALLSRKNIPTVGLILYVFRVEQSRVSDIFEFSLVTYLHVWAGRIYLTRKMLRQKKCSPQ